MEYGNYPAQGTVQSPGQETIQPGQQQQQQPSTVPARGRGRRQYAAQQYDFNAPAVDPMYAQQQQQPQQQPQQYPVPGFQQGQPAPVAPQQYGQPQQQYPQQPGFQYGQEYQQPSSNMYQQPFQQPNVGGMTNQFQGMHVSQPAPLNPLVSVDLMSAPPDVAGLYAPPPPLLLPHGSSLTNSDLSNCPTEYMRSTLGCVPQSNSLLKKTKLPFALTIRPYISLRDEENPVPVVADTVIARCRRCRTYINPFVTFIESGNRWRCVMCGLTNETYDYDPQTRQTLDRMQRPELRTSVVEFVAPTEYMVRPPQPLVYLFLIDVSFPAVTSGLVATATRTILESLDRIPNKDGRTKIGFIAVDSSLHYFSVSPNAMEPQMLVVGDLDDTFLPQPQDLLLNINECREGIEALLTRFNDMFQSNQNGTNAMGSALKAAHKLISPIGGKVVCLMASLPNVSTGKLTPRDSAGAAGTSKEAALLQAQNSFYKSFAVECSKHQVSVDMFLFSSNYQDVATLSCLPRYTGGQTFYYPGWSASRSEDAVKFANEFSKFLAMEIALEAVMRIRATSGLRMASFYGNFFNRSSDLCAFPAFPRDQGYVVEVAIDETITKPFVCLQAAILHSERRIRVLTMAIPTTTNAADVFASADQVALATYLSQRAVEKALSSSLESARDAIINKAVEIFSAYKTNVLASNTGGSTPLQISANLKLLPLLCLGLLKNVGLKKSTQIGTDMRAAALCLLSTLPPAFLVPYIHPRLYAIHEMTDDDGLPGPEGITMPPPLNLNSALFKSHGLYLIDDGQVQFLWIGRDAVPELVQDVFGMGSIEHVKAGKTTLPLLDNSFSPRVNAVLAKSRDMLTGSLYYPHLYVVKEDGDPGLRLWAASTLVEDRSDQAPSYQQFLQQLRDKLHSMIGRTR